MRSYDSVPDLKKVSKMGRIASRFRQKRADPARDRVTAMCREVVTRLEASPSPVGPEDTEPSSGPVRLTGCLWAVLRKRGLLATFGEVFHGLPRRFFLRYIFLKGDVVELRSFLSREADGTLVSRAPAGCPVTSGDVASGRGGSPAHLARHLDTGPGALSQVPVSHATPPQ
jgi:hypothetical protein